MAKKTEKETNVALTKYVSRKYNNEGQGVHVLYSK